MMQNNTTQQPINKTRTDVLEMNNNNCSEYVAYYRVSTDKQGRSGLGIDAQKAMTAPYASQIVQSLTEIESGRKNDRPQLMEALAACKATGATLLVAKLDRLSRSVFFTSQLMSAGVPFLCCDMPEAGPLVIQLMSVLAENEARLTSERTTAALAAAKARGQTLGKPENFNDAHRRKGAAAMRAKAANAYAVVLPLIQQFRASGDTMATIASKLNTMGQTNSRGNPFNQVQVSRILARV